MRFSVFLFFLWAPVLCAAAQSHPCSDIEGASERLACFDALFPDEEDAAVPAAESEPSMAAASAPPAAATVENTWIGDEKVNLSSAIRAVRTEEKQPMIFLLENEQIWMQSSARALPFAKGDQVTIQNALLGGYYMHSEKGASTRVQRIH